MTNMDWRTGVSRVPSRTSHLSCCTTKKDPPIENVSWMSLKTAKAGLAPGNLGSRENFLVLRFLQQKEILKMKFFPQNVNEDNKWCFDLFYAKNLKFFFSGLLWQIIWLKHCCSYHTSWEISIRCSIVISMQEIPSHFLENFCTYQFSCLTRTHFCLAL